MGEHEPVAGHYQRAELTAAIRDAAAEAGIDVRAISLEDLSAIDQFHVRGHEASVDLAELLEPEAGSHVLDVGCGIGGPARHLADRFGCRVTGIDLTEAFCRTGNDISEWVGLSERVTIQLGDACRQPFADATFDAAWSQHAAMNIPDKPALYGETRRTLKPGGRFALYDILQGPGGAVRYPVPWARDPAISHMINPDQLENHLKAAGFRIEHWLDVTDKALAWFEEQSRKRAAGEPPPPAVHVVIGPDFKEVLGNLRKNIAEGRVVLIEAVCVAV